MNFGNPYYGESNTPQQRQDQYTNWNRGYNNTQNSFSSGPVSKNYLVGRLIFSPEQITPQEIPTDGTPALFPLNDGSCIYAKSLQPDGTFAEWRYVLDKPVETEKNVPEPCQVGTTNVLNVEKPTNYDDLVKRIDFLEQVVNELLKGPEAD